MKLYFSFLICIASLFTLINFAQAAKPVVRTELLSSPEKITELITRKQITTEQVPNPHWNKQGCVACHQGKPKKNNIKLKSKRVSVLCGNCHNKLSDESYFHPVDIKPSKSKLQHMSKRFKKFLKNKELSNGKLNCLSCHDIIKQCYTSGFSEKGDNPEFFRGGPYTTRTALCFNCHNKKKYRRFNPHKQISKKGKVFKKGCLMCHTSSKYLFSQVALNKYEFHVGKDWSKMCTGCHPWKPHPGGELAFGKKVPNHLVRPSDSILKTMKKMSKKKNVYFPLEPQTGKLYCGTCHNAHEAGIMKLSAKQKGAKRKFRLRAKKICDYCHDLY